MNLVACYDEKARVWTVRVRSTGTGPHGTLACWRDWSCKSYSKTLWAIRCIERGCPGPEELAALWSRRLATRRQQRAGLQQQRTAKAST